MTSTSGMTAWYRCAEPIGNGMHVTTAHADARHPDGAVVLASDEPSTANQVWHVTSVANGLARIEIMPGLLEGTPDTWFVYVAEPTAPVPAANLVAYPLSVLGEGTQICAGTVVSANRFPLMGVPNDAQIAAIRWYPNDGLIHQIYVRPDARRQLLGSLMLYVASAFHQANGWSGRLHADGRRTELGDQFAAGVRYPHRYSHRYAPLTETQPPMD